MSVIHVRHIKSAVENVFMGRIDLSDYEQRSSVQRDDAFLSRALAAFTLMQLTDVTADRAAEAVVDGYDDNGIDALYYDQSERLLYVIQSKWIHSGNGSPERGDIQKLIKGFQDLLEARLDRFNSKLQSQRETILAALDDAQTKFTLVVSYTGQQLLSEHAQSDIKDLLTELNDPTEVVTPLRLFTQKELHLAVSGKAESSPINLDVLLYDWGQTREPYLAFYGQVEALNLAEWWLGHGPRLFARNLRKFIGSTEVNEAIATTLKMTPEKFWYFNNGVTVLCTRVSKKPLGGAERTTGMFECEGISIVNGAQTVGCIANAYSTNPDEVRQARVALRLISLENCPEGFASEVTRSTNTQNRIERRDFVSLDPEQHRLRTELWLENNKDYAYKSGDSNPSPDKGCNLEESTVALTCCHHDIALAVQAKREIGKLWENIEKPPYKLVINPTLSAMRLWRAVEILRIVDTGLKEQQMKITGRERMIAVHGNRFILYRIFRKLPSPLDDNGIDFEKTKILAAKETVTILNDVTIKVNEVFPGSMLHSLFKNLTKCRELNSKL